MLKILPILTAFFIFAFYLGSKNESRGNLQVHPVAVAHQPAGSQNDGSSSEKSYSKKTIEELIVETFPDEPEIALAVFRSESGLRAGAEGDGGKSIGIAQIHLPSHYAKVEGKTFEEKVERLKDPEYNLKMAKQIRNKSSWSAWTNFRNNRYVAFMEL